MSALFFHRKTQNISSISRNANSYLMNKLIKRSPGTPYLRSSGSWEIYHCSQHYESRYLGSEIEVFLDGYFCDIELDSSYSLSAHKLALWWEKKGVRYLFDLDGGFCALIRDLIREEAYLIRDRWGIKPLYFSKVKGDNELIGGSEIKLLRPWMDRLELDHDGFNDSISLHATVGRETLYHGISQVVASSYIKVNSNGELEEPPRYYQVQFSPLSDPKDFRKWIDQTDSSLRSSISKIANTFKRVAIPLSGGIDSSLLAAYGKEYFEECIAFTIEIENYANPELERAKYVAHSLGVQHEIVHLQSKQVPELFCRAMARLEEPCRHYNNIALLHLFDKIQGFDAILCGDMADTLYGNSKLQTVINLQKKINKLHKIPPTLRKLLSVLLREINNKKAQRIDNLLMNDIEWFIRRIHNVGYNVSEYKVLCQMGINDLVASHLIFQREQICSNKHTSRHIETSLRLNNPIYMHRYDRLSTQTGAEMVYPFLSDSVLRLALTLPDEARFDGTTLKPILRKLYSNLVEKRMVGMSKEGFPTPGLSWINKELIEFKQNAYDPNARLRQFLPFDIDTAQVSNGYNSKELSWWFMTLEESLRTLVKQDGT